MTDTMSSHQSSDQDSTGRQKSKLLIMERLRESDNEASVRDLKASTKEKVEELKEEGEEDLPLHFVPTMGSDTPRSRSFKRALRSCEGSEWVEREGTTVRLTDRGRDAIEDRNLGVTK